MMRMIAVAALALAACANDPKPEIVMVEPEAQAVRPAECNPKADPQWKRLPDSALKKSDIARTDAANARSFDVLTGRRRDCWSVLNAKG
jgi:hypothetical protein